MSRVALLIGLLLAGCVGTEAVVEPSPGTPPETEARVERARAMAALVRVLDGCRRQDCGIQVGSGVEVDTVRVEGGGVVAAFSRDLGDGPVRPAGVAAFEREVARALAPIYPGRPVRVETRGDALAALVPEAVRPPGEQDPERRFDPPVTGPPLVRPADARRQPSAGLAGRHVALWPSHGWLWTGTAWSWQRPRLFTSVEDLLTVGFVTQELAPMLERAGAVTLLARERDVRAREVVVDDGDPGYAEVGTWSDGPVGFDGRTAYGDGQNPFQLGTSRLAGPGGREASWTPDLPEGGAYAVHVSYAPGPDRPQAARYVVQHAGGRETVLVNQQMGAGTWVYLGTWEFAAGTAGAVSLEAGGEGRASADAVRFGGGAGNVARDGATSGRPRWVEASRYYQQFAGAPAAVYDVSDEPDSDYVDDYRSRGEWANWLRGGAFAPTGHPEIAGLGIPVDAVLAWHTDAGVRRDGLIGTLVIYNVPGMDSTRTFPGGTSRLANRDLADEVQTRLVSDLRQRYTPDWPRRPMWDRAYSEATRPQVPALLLELLSHQNFGDMRHALDPRFRFDAARAVYKGLGAFLARQRGTAFVPQPLRPTHLVATVEAGTLQVRWQPQPDPLAPEAAATEYVVYTRDGTLGWAEATRTQNTTVRLPAPPPGVVRSVRVGAVNAGGESRPSAALAVGIAAAGGRPVLVVDGFDRVAGPDLVDEPGRAGFVDPVGVPEGLGVVTVGRQREFDPSEEYVDDASPGWGASAADLEGTPVLGNTRDHAAAHGRALLAQGYSFVSASDEAVEAGTVSLAAYPAVDLVLGLERRTAWPSAGDVRPPAYEALPDALRQRLGAYLDGGGALVVSGAHWASDAANDPVSAAWVRERLGVEPAGVVAPSEAAGRALRVEGRLVPFVTAFGPDRTAVRSPDALAPSERAAVTASYGDGRGAAVSFRRTASFGIPLEAIEDPAALAALFGEVLGRLDVAPR